MDIRHKIERQAYTLYLKADNDLPNGLVSGRHNCFGDGHRPETTGNQAHKYNEVNRSGYRSPIIYIDIPNILECGPPRSAPRRTARGGANSGKKPGGSGASRKSIDENEWGYRSI